MNTQKRSTLMGFSLNQLLDNDLAPGHNSVTTATLLEQLKSAFARINQKTCNSLDNESYFQQQYQLIDTWTNFNSYDYRYLHNHNGFPATNHTITWNSTIGTMTMTATSGLSFNISCGA